VVQDGLASTDVAGGAPRDVELGQLRLPPAASSRETPQRAELAMMARRRPCIEFELDVWALALVREAGAVSGSIRLFA
jgi:hypothetical protein